MYRVLAANAEVRERRNQLRHPAYRKPELLATGPNQVWSWDITKLLGPVKWAYYYLYVLLDIFSRYVVGCCWAVMRVPPWRRCRSPRAASASTSRPTSSPFMPAAARR
jgi:transposase InsO family protein